MKTVMLIVADAVTLAVVTPSSAEAAVTTCHAAKGGGSGWASYINPGWAQTQSLVAGTVSMLNPMWTTGFLFTPGYSTKKHPKTWRSAPPQKVQTMYLGLTSTRHRARRDRYIPGLGTVSSPSIAVDVDMHAYACETCGALYKFQIPADAPFYCACNTLVSLEPQRKDGGA